MHRVLALLLTFSLFATLCLGDTITIDHEYSDLIIESNTFSILVSFEDGTTFDNPQIIFDSNTSFDVITIGDKLQVISNVSNNDISSASKLSVNAGYLVLIWSTIFILFGRKSSSHIIVGIFLSLAVFAVQVNSQSNVVKVRIVTPDNWSYDTIHIFGANGKLSDSSLSSNSVIYCNDLIVDFCSSTTSSITLNHIDVTSQVHLCATVVKTSLVVNPESNIRIESGTTSDIASVTLLTNSFNGSYKVTAPSITVTGNEDCSFEQLNGQQTGTCGTQTATIDIISGSVVLSLGPSESKSTTPTISVSPSTTPAPSSSSVCGGPVIDITSSLNRQSFSEVKSVNYTRTNLSSQPITYTFTPNYDAFLTVSTCNELTNVQTQLRIASGRCESGISQNVQSFCAINNILSPIIKQELFANQLYSVQIESDVVSGGKYNVMFTLRPNLSPLQCESALDVTSSFSTVANGVSEIIIESEYFDEFPFTQSNFYKMTIPFSGLLTASTCSKLNSADSFLSLTKACEDSIAVIESGDVHCPLSNTIGQSFGVSVVAGETYRLEIGSNVARPFVTTIRLQSAGPSCSNVVDISNKLNANQKATVQGALDIGGVDYYQITASSSLSLTASTCNEKTEVDTLITIYSGSCNTPNATQSIQLTANDDSGCALSSTASSVAFSALSQTTYCIAVSTGGQGVGGNYQVDFVPSSPIATTCSMANEVTLSGVSTATVGNAQSLNNQVYYSFTLDSTQRVQISTCNANTIANVTLQLFNAGCVALANPVTVTPGCVYSFATTIAATLQAGEYVFSVLPTSFGFYQVDITVSSAIVSDNSNACQSKDITSNLLMNKQVAESFIISDNNNVVYFSFTPIEDSTIAVSTCSALTNADTTISFQANSCSAAIQNTYSSSSCSMSSDQAEVSYRLAAGVKYIIGVGASNSYGGFVQLTFHLSDTRTSCDSSSELISSTNNNDLLYGSGYLVAEESAYYRVTFSQTTTFFASTCAQVGTSQTNENTISVYDASVGTCSQVMSTGLRETGSSVNGVCGVNSAATSVSATIPSGTYIIKVSGVGYHLLTLLSVPLPANNVCSSATLLSELPYQVPLHGIRQDAFEEYYRIVLSQDSVVRVSTCSSLTTIDSVINLFTSDCSSPRLIASVDDSTNCPYSFKQSILEVPLTAGEYIIQIQNLQNSGFVDLTVSTSAFSSSCDTATLIHEGELFTNGYKTSGLIPVASPSSVAAYYKFTVIQQSRVIISTCGADTAFATQLALFSGDCSNGRSLVSNTNHSEVGNYLGLCEGYSNSLSLIDTTLSPGRYYFSVASVEAFTNGSFNLAVYFLS